MADIGALDVVVYGPQAIAASLSARLSDPARLVGIVTGPELPGPISVDNTLVVTPEALSAVEGLSDLPEFEIQVDGEEQPVFGSLGSTQTELGGGFSLHDYSGSLDGGPLRAFAVEDPFPLVIVPVLVAIAVVGAVMGNNHRNTLNSFRDLARDCVATGGQLIITDKSGASVEWDGKVKLKLANDLSFTCKR